MKLTFTERELLEEVREINSRHRVLGRPCKDSTLYRAASRLVALGLARWEGWELFPVEKKEMK